MTRPLRYDDAFVNILKDKMHEKFLGLIRLKVQSTTFCQKFNLQKGLLICSLVDIIYGIIFLYLFISKMEEYQGNTTFLIENGMAILCIFFGLIGLDTALNLKKIHSSVYKSWRIFFTIYYILFEIANSFNSACFFIKTCSFFSKFVLFLIYSVINVYITKISWSFYIRLEQSHEILIIHGKYLEKMINEELLKYDATRKYNPPSLINNLTTNSTEGNYDSNNFKPGEVINSKQQQFQLYKNEKQITTGGNIRESLNNNVTDNKYK